MTDILIGVYSAIGVYTFGYFCGSPYRIRGIEERGLLSDLFISFVGGIFWPISWAIMTYRAYFGKKDKYVYSLRGY
jgi:hypothetical protein